MTKSLSINIIKAISWNSYIQLSDESKAQLLFWKKSLFQLNRKSLQCIKTCSRIVYSDASNTGYAGYEVNTYKGIVHGVWDSQEFAQSSLWRELCAVYRVLISLQDVLRCQRVKWFTDNVNVSNIVAKGSMKENLQELAFRIYQFCSKNCIHLETEWLPIAEN